MVESQTDFTVSDIYKSLDFLEDEYNYLVSCSRINTAFLDQCFELVTLQKVQAKDNGIGTDAWGVRLSRKITGVNGGALPDYITKSGDFLATPDAQGQEVNLTKNLRFVKRDNHILVYNNSVPVRLSEEKTEDWRENMLLFNFLSRTAINSNNDTEGQQPVEIQLRYTFDHSSFERPTLTIQPEANIYREGDNVIRLSPYPETLSRPESVCRPKMTTLWTCLVT